MSIERKRKSQQKEKEEQEPGKKQDEPAQGGKRNDTRKEKEQGTSEPGEVTGRATTRNSKNQKKE
jgi:hypothetical protein